MAEIKIDTANVSEKELNLLNSIDHAITNRSQVMRLWRILVVAPLLISAGKKSKGLSSFHKRVLRGAGWATLLVNGFQYYKTLRLEKVVINTPNLNLNLDNKKGL